ncbi:hypothetical protein BC938DRAFT_476666, partial [Jimgerdemannia flammicorona]
MSRPATSAFQALDRATSRHLLHRPPVHPPRTPLASRRPHPAPTPANPTSTGFTRHGKPRPFSIHRPYSTAAGSVQSEAHDAHNRQPKHDHEHEESPWEQNLRPSTKACWKCDASIPYLSVHCERDDCGVIQRAPEEEANYFEVLEAGLDKDGSTPTFDLDLKTLRNKFLRVQQRVHPDSYSQKSEREHTYAETQSSFVNKAYHTLRNPLARAQYMLQLRGEHVGEAESLEDPELLMEVLEAREELEEAGGEEEVDKLKRKND